jgi:hypothetical protein
MPVMCFESRLELILFSHPHLMIPPVHVQFGKELGASQLIEDLIN